MSDTPSTPVSRPIAFVLGFTGFLAFAFLSLLAVTFFKNRGSGYEDERSKARLGWRAAASEADAVVRKTAWKDQGAGLVQVSANDYLPIAAKGLVSLANSPRPMQGDQFIVPGTPTFEAFTARQAAAQTPVPPADPEAAPVPPADPEAAPAPAPEAAPAPNP
jgi:hypothetical protein